MDLQAGVAHNSIEHRLQVREADLDPATHPGAQYLAELYVLSHDDVDHTNSLGWKHFTVNGAPGADWTLEFEEDLAESGSAFRAWSGATVTTIPEDLAEGSEDGRCYLIAKVTENANGTWHYEYAIFNLDMARAIASLSIPVDLSTFITNIEFNAVRSHGEAFSNVPWNARRTDDSLIWETEPFELNPRSNPLRWGTLYNFRFDANVEATEVIATLHTFMPGIPSEFSGATLGPAPAAGPPIFIRGDASGDSMRSLVDAIQLLRHIFARGGPLPCEDSADFDDNGRLSLEDAVGFIQWVFARGAPPKGPYPECGLDPSVDNLACDHYLACEG